MRHRRFVNTSDFRTKLGETFKALRKEGFIARQNFKCCGSCAGYAIASDIESMSAVKRAKVKGCVFYHAQDNSRLNETGQLYLAYGELDTEKHGKVGLPTVEVGKRVVEVLTEKGFTVEWDGSEDSRILVTSVA